MKFGDRNSSLSSELRNRYSCYQFICLLLVQIKHNKSPSTLPKALSLMTFLSLFCCTGKYFLFFFFDWLADLCIWNSGNYVATVCAIRRKFCARKACTVHHAQKSASVTQSAFERRERSSLEEQIIHSLSTAQQSFADTFAHTCFALIHVHTKHRQETFAVCEVTETILADSRLWERLRPSLL